METLSCLAEISMARTCVRILFWTTQQDRRGGKHLPQSSQMFSLESGLVSLLPSEGCSPCCTRSVSIEHARFNLLNTPVGSRDYRRWLLYSHKVQGKASTKCISGKSGTKDQSLIAVHKQEKHLRCFFGPHLNQESGFANIKSPKTRGK